MPLAAEPVTFNWNPSTSSCGCLRDRESFTGEFFQKIRETKTTLDRIYLSSLSKPAHLTTVHDYEEWARKSGRKDEMKHRRSQPSSKKTRPSKLSSKCRPLGISDEKIKSALDCSLWEDKKDKVCKLPHPLARVQCYDLRDDYVVDQDRTRLEYSRDSAKVWRVMQEEIRQQTNQRLTKGKCGSVLIRRQTRQKVRSLSSSTEDETSCEDNAHENDVEITLEQTRSESNGRTVTTFIDKQKIAFSKIKKSGVVKSNTIDYRLPKLNAVPIKDRTNIPIEKTPKLPQLGNCKRSRQEKKKRKKGREQLKRTSSDKTDCAEKSKGDEKIVEVTSNSETDNIASPKLDEVTEKLSEITKVKKKRTHRPKITCKRVPDDDNLADYPFLKMGLDTDSESDEECLCDYCLGMTSEVPKTQPRPLKSILSPRQRPSGSAKSNKNVSFQQDGLEDVRLITPLAIRNENMKRYEDEERRERLKQQDMKRRQRRAAILARRNKAAYKGLELMAGETSSATKIDGDCGSQTATRDEDCVKEGDPSTEERTKSSDNKLNAERKDVSSVSSELDNSDIDKTSESSTLYNAPSDDSSDIPLTSSPELKEVPALLLDPQEHGRLYEDIVLEEGDGHVTVAQLGHRIKSIFDREPVVRDRASDSSPESARVHANDGEMVSKEREHSESSDDDTKGGAFVTKCVVWNETSDSTNTSRSVTPLPQVERQDLSEFILSMRECRYIRWSKSYMDMLEKLGE
ncbi:uncharacterized protein [Diadema setosum]|uniref:uncharacterized protein n=1 Tax=Diadema setosum TaxID=31175 RepID=UPI003B3B8C02